MSPSPVAVLSPNLSRVPFIDSRMASGMYTLAMRAWEFTTTTDESWTSSSGYLVGFGWQTGGYVGGTFTGADPSMISADNLGVNITNAKRLAIRLKNTTAAKIAAVYFTTNSEPGLDEVKAKRFTIVPDADYTEYIVDLSSNAKWTGTLRRLRLDPEEGVTSGSLSIDYIRVIQ